jgi:hypothetical protein
MTESEYDPESDCDTDLDDIEVSNWPFHASSVLKLRPSSGQLGDTIGCA